MTRQILFASFLLFSLMETSYSFGVARRSMGATFGVTRTTTSLSMGAQPKLEMIPQEQEGIPMPFVDTEQNTFIDCYADSKTTIDGVSYTIGCPCDYSVALCYFDEDEQLIPVELDDKIMEDVYPIAENIVEEEFGEELSLQRTPQTLTLVGELEDEEDEDDEDEDDDDMEDGEEQVEVLLSFDHRGTEFNLVRLLDPVLLVAKADPEDPNKMLLLTPEESDKIMPTLESMFLEFNEERDTMSF
mmetsp:Transcript_16756/g.23288  ORF Transcript_16756/g.23288 Transcript_16756/m.23288 type:complete len:244 (-) Transcript_16756:65-796(-)